MKRKIYKNIFVVGPVYPRFEIGVLGTQNQRKFKRGNKQTNRQTDKLFSVFSRDAVDAIYRIASHIARNFGKKHRIATSHAAYRKIAIAIANSKILRCIFKFWCKIFVAFFDIFSIFFSFFLIFSNFLTFFFNFFIF